jgi:ferredoxin
MDTSKLVDPTKPFGPITKEDWEVFVDKDLCIGAGVCTAIAAQTFELDEDGKAVILKGIDQENKEAILDAARACPVAAIIIKKQNGEKVFPE